TLPRRSPRRDETEAVMLVLSNVAKLYDGASDTKSSVRANVDLFVDGGVVNEIKPHDAKLALGEAHAKVDCSKLFVTPGLVDCHGHLTILGLSDRDMDLMNAGA